MMAPPVCPSAVPCILLPKVHCLFFALSERNAFYLRLNFSPGAGKPKITLKPS
jgi:hypothetical protein